MRRGSAWLAVIGLSMTLLWSRPASAGDVTFVEQHAQWEISYGAVYFRAFGTLQNTSGKPITYVKLQLDFLDAKGKSVYTFIGYNQKAETLGAVEGIGADTMEKTSAADKLKKVEALKAGEKDLYRLGVSKEDIPKTPKFKKTTLKIIEIKK